MGLRSLSALLGTATVPLAYVLGGQLAGRRAALVGAALVAFNPMLVWYSRALIRVLGLRGNAHIHLQNYWHVNLSDYDIAVVFGLKPMMSALETKLNGVFGFSRDLRSSQRFGMSNGG